MNTNQLTQFIKDCAYIKENAPGSWSLYKTKEPTEAALKELRYTADSLRWFRHD